MGIILPIIYLTIFAVIAGGAFALMWANIQAINAMNRPIVRRRHPEAPEAGEEVMYVDLTREKLEDLYKQDSE